MNLKSEVWIQWLSATAVASAVLVSFAYSSFATKEEAKDAKSNVEKRLDRLESKMDLILEKVTQ